jgi:hypothetical protein
VVRGGGGRRAVLSGVGDRWRAALAPPPPSVLPSVGGDGGRGVDPALGAGEWGLVTVTLWLILPTPPPTSPSTY